MYKPKAENEVPEGKKDGYYFVKVMCTNCGLKKELGFKKADKIETHCCPNCETTNLERI